ncbi:MAG: AAA family ATPase [Desulfuromonadaceae bacterium]|nr:AAA family ATPase [Desulfuromonadaceae bacterium]
MKETLTLNTLVQHVLAGTPLLAVATDNEQRSIKLVQTAIERAMKDLPQVPVWDCINGFSGQPATTAPQAALSWALEQPGAGVYIFTDLHWYWHDAPQIQRLLLNFIYQRGSQRKTLVFVANRFELPEVLQNQMVQLVHPLPNAAELSNFLESSRDNDPFIEALLREDNALQHLITAALGLDLLRLDRALRLARVSKINQLDEVVAALHLDKKRAIEQSGVLEFVDNRLSEEQVGGMENLKKWMAKREQAFGAEALAHGENLPSGVLLMGISGCGKSLFVKAIAARWYLPLLRLDMATVYEGTYGSPEHSLHQACRLAEAMSPCVLWIDELESGISDQGFKSGGGAASRVLGYFLTWMQEKQSPVFVAATANAIEMLPAEVLRKGRFDEIFYIALPGLKERRTIFEIHLRMQGFDPQQFDPEMLAHSSKGFSGAEIEQAVASGKFEAQSLQRPMTQKDIMEALGKTVPISVTMAEQIKKIEAWAFKRAVPASDQSGS